jgi:hypothetical protein
VRAVVRNASDETKTAHLRALPVAAGGQYPPPPPPSPDKACAPAHLQSWLHRFLPPPPPLLRKQTLTPSPPSPPTYCTGSLEFASGDLLKPGSFDDAFVGVDAVMHTAAVVLTNSADPQKDIVDPSVKGTVPSSSQPPLATNSCMHLLRVQCSSLCTLHTIVFTPYHP